MIPLVAIMRRCVIVEISLKDRMTVETCYVTILDWTDGTFESLSHLMLRFEITCNVEKNISS